MFFIAYGPDKSTLIFNKHTTAWGSFFYDEKDDALRVDIKPEALRDNVERLTYAFSNQTDSSAEISLQWEKLRFPFTVSTELQKLQLASIADEMNGPKSFYGNNWLEAGLYLKQQGIESEKALAYFNNAARSMPNFFVLSNKAELLESMGKTADADASMKDAVKAANNANQVHTYARRLLTEKKTQKAFEMFKLNYEKFPDTYTTNVGMARGYQAIGNNKQALKYANKALPQAPDAANKASIEELIKSLKGDKVASK